MCWSRICSQHTSQLYFKSHLPWDGSVFAQVQEIIASLPSCSMLYLNWLKLTCLAILQLCIYMYVFFFIPHQRASFLAENAPSCTLLAECRNSCIDWIIKTSHLVGFLSVTTYAALQGVKMSWISMQLQINMTLEREQRQKHDQRHEENRGREVRTAFPVFICVSGNGICKVSGKTLLSFQSSSDRISRFLRVGT